MAGPGDPDQPKPADHDHDDLVGFASPAHLAGRPRVPEPEPEPASGPEPAPEPEPELFDEPVSEPALDPEPDFEPDLAEEAAPEPEPEPVIPEPPVFEAPEPAPVIPPVAVAPPSRLEEPAPPRQRARPAAPPAAPQAAPMGLYAVYALTLFAVPTLGASAALALLAVTGREAPRDAMAASHFIYQQRTLWTGAVVALLGVILIVINIGVFVLFLVALWLMARGVWGVLRLKAGQPIPNPRSWLF